VPAIHGRVVGDSQMEREENEDAKNQAQLLKEEKLKAKEL
jgi:hypothetical protein